MTTFEEFDDPRLVALYDLLDPDRADLACFLALAEEFDPTSIVDLGCGTGVLAVALAARGYQVTGVDPALAMLGVARSRAGGDLVRWVEGDAAGLAPSSADLVLMTAHVAQVIADAAWRSALAGVRRALRPGGRLIFDSRNPAAQGWLAWSPEATRAIVEGPSGDVEVWWQVTDTREDPLGVTVQSQIHYRFLGDGEEVVSHNVLRFRPLDALEASLDEAGLVLERIYGDWDFSPLRPESPEFVVVAGSR